MKKILLSAVAFMAAMTMNAQEVCSFNVDNALGLDSDNGTTLTAGTVIGETTSIVAKIGADNTYKPQSVQGTVGGQDINGGLQGSDNPKDADSGTPSGTLKAPVSGAYLEFEAKANGWLYVIHKASSNKAYTVFEEGEAIGYTFAAIGDAACDLGAVYQFTLQGAGEYNYLSEAGLTGVEWAEREYLKAAKPDVYASRLTVDAEGKETWSGDDLKKGGIGVIKFAVYEGCKYIVNANGSKITAGGFFFDTTGDAAVVAGDVTILAGEGGNTPAPTIEVWTIAGGSKLMGSDWNTADTSNDMTSTDGVIYTLVKEGVVLEKGVTYEFKAAKDHAWAEAYPSSNAQLTVEETATYTVTFTFNASTKEVSASVEKTGEAEVGEKAYSVIGTINGNWDADTDMTKGEDGIYTAVFNDVKAGSYEFKVRVDKDWSEAYPSSNYKVEVAADGSTVTVTFNAETKEVVATVSGGSAPVPVGDGEICSFNVDNALGLDSDAGTTLTAGTVIGETESIVAKIGADNTYKPQSVQATVDGQEINGGLQGSDNPKDADSGTPSGTLKAPVSGAYLEFEAKANGWLYVIHKASSNKAYTVFEEGEAIGYTFAAIGDAACDLGAVYQFTLQGAGEYNYLTEAGLTGVEWAEREYLKAAKPDVYASRLTVDAEGKETWSGDDLKKGGIGVIKFAVFEGCKYIVNANGSKITAGGFYFDTTGAATIAAGDVTILSGTGTAIQATKFFKAENAAIYNLAGQKVDGSYKGIVIQNGKKFIQK